MEARKPLPQPSAQPVCSSTPPLCLEAATLFASRREVLIDHDGECYRLRLTRQNKLILTK